MAEAEELLKKKAATEQKQNEQRQGAISAGIAKILGMQDMAFAKTLLISEPANPQDRLFDVNQKERCFIVRQGGMDKLIEAAKNAAQRQLNWNPGDFSLCGTNSRSIEGVVKFISAIPEMKVKNVVFLCPLTDEAIRALVKAVNASNGTLNVTLKDQGANAQFLKAKDAEKPAVGASKSLAVPPPAGKNPVSNAIPVAMASNTSNSPAKIVSDPDNPPRAQA